jgi:hypothetical protein
VGRVTVSGLALLMAVLGGTVAGCAPAAPTSDFAFIEGSAISCSSAESCLAVGTLDPDGNATPVADAWNGRQWRPLAVRLPKGTSGGLDYVSCKAGSCLAIGSYIPDAGGYSQGLAITWSGGTLRPIPAPPASGGENTVDGLSCVSAGACITLTSSMDSESSAVDTWNGSGWTTRPAADPEGVAPGISTLSCVSATFCVAGGSAPTSDPGSRKPLLASWNGTRITPMKVPAPAATDIPTDYGPPVIYAVSCVSATSCAAVGTYLTDSSAATGFGFTEVLSGSSWKESTIAWPGAGLSMLFGVSCTSARSCLAVGTAGSPTTGLRAAAVSYNGKAWVRQTDLPRPGHGNSAYFGDVSCPAARDCITAGQIGPAPFYSATPIFGIWNGRSWKDGRLKSNGPAAENEVPR